MQTVDNNMTFMNYPIRSSKNETLRRVLQLLNTTKTQKLNAMILFVI